MKPHEIVFVVLMVQTLLAMAWFKFGLVPLAIWVVGCLITDIISAIVWSENK